jgi:hypothetical protein
LSSSIHRILGGFSPLHIGFLGLVLSIPTSVFAGHLIVMRFSLPLSLFLLALVIGGGYAYLGWQWKTSPSIRTHLVRTLLVFACMAVLLAIVLMVDRALLISLTDDGRTVVYDIPGVHIEASGPIRQIAIVNDPPYWLAVMIYGILTAVGGSLAQQVHARWSIRTAKA